MEDAMTEKLLVGYRQLAEFLTAAGFPTSKSTMSKYCAPSLNIGPPVEAYWGKLPAFRPSRSLEWARQRLRPPMRRTDRTATTAMSVADTSPV
jgi:hypothetical protein